MEEARTILVDLPTSVRGFVVFDENSDPVIVVNARLSREQNRLTWIHERRHIHRGEMNKYDYVEYKG